MNKALKGFSDDLRNMENWLIIKILVQLKAHLASLCFLCLLILSSVVYKNSEALSAEKIKFN